MTGVLGERALLNELQKQTAALGLTLRGDAGHGLSGEAEKIRAKWWLGGRKVTYRMSCQLTEPIIPRLPGSRHGAQLEYSPSNYGRDDQRERLETLGRTPRCFGRRWRRTRLRQGAQCGGSPSERRGGVEIPSRRRRMRVPACSVSLP